MKSAIEQFNGREGEIATLLWCQKRLFLQQKLILHLYICQLN